MAQLIMRLLLVVSSPAIYISEFVDGLCKMDNIAEELGYIRATLEHIDHRLSSIEEKQTQEFKCPFYPDRGNGNDLLEWKVGIDNRFNQVNGAIKLFGIVGGTAFLIAVYDIIKTLTN